MNRFDQIQYGSVCPRCADRRVIHVHRSAATVSCAPHIQPLEYAQVAKTVRVHDLSQYADDPESAADLELALEQAGVLR